MVWPLVRRPLAACGLFGLAAACGSAGTAPDGGPPPARDDAAASADASGPDGSGLADGGGPDDAAAEGTSDANEAPPDAAPAARFVAYASGYAPAIQWLSVSAQTGALTSLSSLASFGPAPSFLAIDRATRHLYAVDESSPGQVGAYAIDPAAGALTFLGAVSSGGDGPPFVAVDGPWVLVANYASGTVAVLPVKGDGSLGPAVDTQMAGALAHMIVADAANHFVFVPCKGSDYVAQYSFDATTGKLTPNAVPHMSTAPGAGPRHLAFHPDGATAYLVDETDSTMSALALDPAQGTLSIAQTVSTRPAGATGPNTAAEVHVHPSGRWLFGSNRGDDTLVVFPLDASGRMGAPTFTSSGGAMPRDFALDATGTFLYAANQNSGNLVTFHFEASTGTLTPTGGVVAAPSVSFVGLAALP